MQTSQYSSVASSIAPDKSLKISPSLKSMPVLNKELTIKNAGLKKRCKNGRSIFPPDFFESN